MGKRKSTRHKQHLGNSSHDLYNAIQAPIEAIHKTTGLDDHILDSINAIHKATGLDKTNRILDSINAPAEVIKPSLNLYETLVADFEIAEKTMAYQMAVAEYEAEREENEQLRAQIEQYKTNIAKIQKIVGKPEKTIQSQRQLLSLKAVIYPKEIESLHKHSETTFVATLEQWQNVFSDDIQPMYENPIELKKGIGIVDLRLFLHWLVLNEIVFNKSYCNICEKVGMFKCNGKLITSKQLRDAIKGQKGTTRNNDLIEDIIIKTFGDNRKPLV